MASHLSPLEQGRNAAIDAELVRAAQSEPDAQAGRAAAGELLRRHQRSVYLLCYRYVRDHDRALDLAQDVLLSAYRKLATFSGRSGFSSWLFAITRNRCLNEMKHVRLLAEEPHELEDVRSPYPGPDVELEYQEDHERVLKLIEATLEPVEQRAIWLRCFERLPVDEITAMLQIESGTGARAVLQSARRKLRAALNREQGTGKEGK